MNPMFTLTSIKKQQKRLEKIKNKNQVIDCPKVDTDKAMKKLKRTLK